MQPKHHPAGTPVADVDFARAPFIVFWELTRACALACRHCRAEAQPQRHPDELTSEEGLRLLDDIARFGSPLLVITGGDPLTRRDLTEFVAYGALKGLRVSLAPSATRLVTSARMDELKWAGIARVSISLDGHEAQVHDSFRRTPGSFARTMAAAQEARAAGLPLQINTTVSRFNDGRLAELAEVVGNLDAVLWSLFFLVPTGRGQRADMISPERHEEVFNWLYDLAGHVPFDVKTTAAEHYRRVIVQRRRQEGLDAGGAVRLEVTKPGFVYADGLGRAAKGVNDGNGCCFISHVGDVYPSGFLPLSGGNVRRQSVVDIYRQSPLFLELRDTSKLKGKCGRCDFNVICGGSRARAYALTGDYLAAEPCCVYQPQRAEVTRV